MIALAALLAAAQSPANCDDPMSMGEMRVCARETYLAADAELDRQWETTVAHMRQLDAEYPPQDNMIGYLAAAEQAQEAWLTYRSAHCLSESFKYRGGSMASMVQFMCLAELTEARTEQLRQLLEYQE